MPDTHELILLPQWAIKVCDLLEPKATLGELANRIAEGKSNRQIVCNTTSASVQRS